MPLLPDHLPDPMAQRSRGDAGGAGGLRLDGAACQQHVAAVKISRCLVGLMDIFAEHIILYCSIYIYTYILLYLFLVHLFLFQGNLVGQLPSYGQFSWPTFSPHVNYTIMSTTSSSRSWKV